MKFVLASLFLSLALWATAFIVPEHRVQAILGMVAASYIVSAWVLFEDLKGVEWFTVLILPVLYTLGAGLFSLFLPESLPRIFGLRMETEVARLVAKFVKALFWGGFGIGFYALYLTENIFSVAAIRTIQLLRAAHAVGFLLTLLVGLFLFQAIFSFRLAIWAVFLLVGVLSFFLYLQGNWSMQLKEGLSRRSLLYSFVGALVTAELGAVLSFWPVKALTGALMLVTASYVLLGLSEQYLAGRLFKNQVNEYIAVAVVVLFASFYITSWR